MDIRAVPIIYPGIQFSINVELEQPEPNMTVGDQYIVVGMVVDSAVTPPKPYAITFDDDQHFKFVDLAKVKRANLLGGGAAP
jgi:hypothetical protein